MTGPARPASSTGQTFSRSARAIAAFSSVVRGRIVDPVIRTGQGTLTIKGAVATGRYVVYEGAATATVYTENWRRVADLPVVKHDYMMPAGFAPVSVTSAGGGPQPWLEVQFLVEGTPIAVPAAGAR